MRPGDTISHLRTVFTRYPWIAPSLVAILVVAALATVAVSAGEDGRQAGLLPRPVPSAVGAIPANVGIDPPVAAISVASTPNPYSVMLTLQATARAASGMRRARIGLATATPTGTPRPVYQDGDVVGRIQIPVLDIDVPVVQVSWHMEEVAGQLVAVWDTVRDAAAYHRGTASFGGQGNCVISGHVHRASIGVFYGLWDLRPGDEIILISSDGSQYTYSVTSVKKIPEAGADLEQRLANASWIEQTDDTRLTLVTCWPDWAYTHRVIVVAHPEED